MLKTRMILGCALAFNLWSSAPAQAISMEEDVGSIFELGKAQFCTKPQDPACLAFNKFLQGHYPKVPKAETISLGLQYSDDETAEKPDKLPTYLTLHVKPKGKEIEAIWSHLRPENEAEDKATTAYLKSIASGHRLRSSAVHKALETELAKIPLAQTEPVLDILVVRFHTRPGGAYIRQYKNEWIVIALEFGGPRTATLYIAAMPMDPA